MCLERMYEMEIIICNILIALIGVGITPYMKNLIEAFSNEEKITWKTIFKKTKFDIKLALLTPLVMIALFYRFGISFEFLIYSFVSVLLIMDAFVDMKAQIIPNGLNFAGFIVGIILAYIALVVEPMSGVDMLLGMFAGAGIFLLIALFALVAYKKEGMGLGDVKLMGMLGLFFGLYNTIQIFIISFAIGAVISIILLATKIKKSTDYMAFGPFIVIAAIFTMFVPYTIAYPWYLSLMMRI